MKQRDKPLDFAERVKAHPPLWFEYAKRHGLTPEQYQTIQDKQENAWRKGQRTSLLPFPLPDKYKNDADSLLPRDALNAVNAYRLVLLRFGPDRDEDEDQLKKATDVALGIRLAWSDEYDLELAEVPLAKDFKPPTDEDFARLEQWFLTAANAIKKEIASRSETTKKQPASGEKAQDSDGTAAGPASDARQGAGKATGKPDAAIAKARSRAPGAFKERGLVFICYCRKDKKWLNEMRKMLAPVIKGNVVPVWHDQSIRPGKEWRREIATALRKTKVGVLLVTKNFLASEFINKVELKYLRENARTNRIKLLPVSVGHCMWEKSPLARLQFVNDPLKPLEQCHGPNRDRLLKEVCEKIEEAYNEHSQPKRVNTVRS
jgi:hypothetical protein